MVRSVPGSPRECSHQHLPIPSAAQRGKALGWSKLTLSLIQGRPSGSLGGGGGCDEQQGRVQREAPTHADGRALWVSKVTFLLSILRQAKCHNHPDEIKINSPDEPKRARIIAFSVWGILRWFVCISCVSSSPFYPCESPCPCPCPWWLKCGPRNHHPLINQCKNHCLLGVGNVLVIHCWLEQQDMLARSIFRGLESFSQLVYLKKGSNSQVIRCNHFPVEAQREK